VDARVPKVADWGEFCPSDTAIFCKSRSTFVVLASMIAVGLTMVMGFEEM